MGARILTAIIATGSTLTNSTAETVLASFTMPANHWQAGKYYEIQAVVSCPSTNSTDTLTLRIRVGTTTLTGTVIAASAAVDVADNDVGVIRIGGIVRSIGSSANCVWGGTAGLGVETTATGRVVAENDGLNTLVDQLVELTGQWSVASASNQVAALAFQMIEIV